MDLSREGLKYFNSQKDQKDCITIIVVLHMMNFQIIEELSSLSYSFDSRL